ncbi:hypothetical protein TNCV_673761 [Trichonephila clavipes]|uniref:Uncharacterized protein n=1 Tax=Trichonephila clavipes TaxID=2585209 RepID=A0A8X6WEL2_TRICX|nr:hypothetical protein TNCV_673761 [Trichonephila clavipes]
MSVCGRVFHIVCMLNQSSSVEATGRRSRAIRRPTISHSCSIGDISGEYAGQGRSFTCCESRYDLTVLATFGRHYPAGIQPLAILAGKEYLGAVKLRLCIGYCSNCPLFVAIVIVHDMLWHLKP